MTFIFSIYLILKVCHLISLFLISKLYKLAKYYDHLGKRKFSVFYKHDLHKCFYLNAIKHHIWEVSFKSNLFIPQKSAKITQWLYFPKYTANRGNLSLNINKIKNLEIIEQIMMAILCMGYYLG